MKISNIDLGKQAYEIIKDLIISRQLLPGQKIVQEKLAKELGISRTPLRTGLQMLEAESLIESIPRRGVIVKEFTNDEILEIYDCRIALEGMAVRLFTEKAGSSEIEELASLFEPFMNCETIEIDSYQKADSIFHNTIIKKCGNGFLYDLFQKGNLLGCIDLIGLLRPPEETLVEHLEIIAAIKKRDGELAAALIQEHLVVSKNLIISRDENEN